MGDRPVRIQQGCDKYSAAYPKMCLFLSIMKPLSMKHEKKRITSRMGRLTQLFLQRRRERKRVCRGRFTEKHKVRNAPSLEEAVIKAQDYVRNLQPA